MRIRFLKVIYLAGSLLASTLAANAEEVLTAHIPFAFVAGGKAFSAGDYRFNKGGESAVMMIRGAGNSAAFLTTAQEPGGFGYSASLVFERHAGTLVLSAIRMAGERSLRLQLVSGAAKNAAPQLTSAATSR